MIAAPSLEAGLVLLAKRIARARYYVALETADSSSGFFPKAVSRSGAIAETEAYLLKYPAWEVARVYNRETNALVKTVRQSEVSR